MGYKGMVCLSFVSLFRSLAMFVAFVILLVWVFVFVTLDLLS